MATRCLVGVIAGADVADKITVGDKITKASVTVPATYKPRAFGPTRNAEPQTLFYPVLPQDAASRTYSKTVKVKVAVGATGSVEINLTRGSGDEDIDEAIVAAIRQVAVATRIKNGPTRGTDLGVCV